MSDQQEAKKAETAKPKRRRKWRWVVMFLLLVVVGLVVGGPTIVSSDAGTNFVVGQINSRIVGSVEITDLNAAWLSGQSLSGVTLRDAAGDVVLQDVDVDLKTATLLSAAAFLLG